MSSDKQLNYVNNLQNRDQNLYYVDDATELNSINLKENDKIYAINDNKLFQMEIADQEEELSGSIVSFNGRNNTKIKSLVTNIEPVQDLHGYDNPWPAGGGKNLYAPPAAAVTSNGVTLTPNKDESVTLSGQANSVAALFYSPVDIPSGTTVTIGLNNTDVNAEVGVRLLSTTSAGSGTQYGTMVSADTVNKKLTFTTTFAAKSINVFVKTNHGEINNITLKVMVELGSTSGAFEPYKNICPITGNTGMTGKRMGKNLLPLPFKVPNVGSSFTAYGVTMTHNKDGTLSFTGTATSVIYFYFNVHTTATDHSTDFNYAPGNYIFSSGLTDGSVNGYRLVFSIYNDGTWVRGYADLGSGVNITIKNDETEAVYLYIPSGKVMDGVILKPMLRLASNTDATFEPYIVQDISVNWQSQAGTVYGATLDVISGVLTADRETFSVDGSTSITTITEMTNVIRFWVYTNAKFNMIDNHNYLKVMSDRLTYSLNFTEDKPSFNLSDQYKQSLVIKMPKGTCEATVEGIRAYLQANPLQFVLPLAEPVIYQLTPQEVTTLLGANNIWTDVGDITVKIAEKGITAFELEPHI